VGGDREDTGKIVNRTRTNVEKVPLND